jgi:hypothetical protein
MMRTRTLRAKGEAGAKISFIAKAIVGVMSCY